MALSAARNTPEWAPNTTIRSYPQKASTTIYAGSLVVLDTSLQAKPGVSATGLLVVGRASFTQTVGASATLSQIQVEEGIFGYGQNGTAFDYQDVGKFCYVYDDATVTLDPTGASIAGTVQRVDSDGTVWVAMGLPGASDTTAAAAVATDLAAEIVSLASTSADQGAHLVGYADSGSLYSATAVDTALTEVRKVADAALAAPLVASIYLSQLTSGSLIGTYSIPVACKIAQVDARVSRACAATGTATIKCLINGSAVSGGALTLVGGSLATMGARVTGSAVTAANTLAAADLLTISAVSNGVAFTDGVIDIAVYFASA